jgi:hypothetical protein
MNLEKGISVVHIGREESDRNDGTIHFFLLATEKKTGSLQL